MTVRWWHLVLIAVLGAAIGWWLSPGRGIDTSMNPSMNPSMNAVHSVNGAVNE